MEELLSKHLLDRRQYTINTPMTGTLVDTLSRWIKFGSTGGIIYGSPRSGKSVGARLARSVLQSCYPHYGVAFTGIYSTSLGSAGSFYSDLLREAEHSFANSGSEGQRRERYMEHLCTLLSQRGGDRCLLFIDEAHRLGYPEYEALLDTQNWLESRSIGLCVFLFGQTEEMVDFRTSLQKQRRLQILGRFMCLDHHFRGLQTLEQLESILDGYDCHSEYPRGSKITFTEHYMGELYRHDGWRLKAYARQIWESFLRIRENEGLGAHEYDIPMLYVCRTIESLLLHLAETPADAKQLEGELIAELIKISGYVGSLRLVEKP